MSDATDGGSGAASTGEAPTVTPGEAFAALADRRRRAVLSYLHGRPNETVTLRTLAGAVSRGNHGSDSVGRVAASLSRTCLPELAASGLVEYDRERRTVEYTAPSFVGELLARLPERR